MKRALGVKGTEGYKVQEWNKLKDWFKKDLFKVTTNDWHVYAKEALMDDADTMANHYILLKMGKNGQYQRVVHSGEVGMLLQDVHYENGHCQEHEMEEWFNSNRVDIPRGVCKMYVDSCRYCLRRKQEANTQHSESVPSSNTRANIGDNVTTNARDSIDSDGAHSQRALSNTPVSTGANATVKARDSSNDVDTADADDAQFGDDDTSDSPTNVGTDGTTEA
jgi:hypothetical protein